jgi:hypothetical protein
LKMPDLSARLASPDNRRFAYIASVAGKAVVVTDGKQGPQYDSIVKHTLSFSPDSQRLVYAAKRNGQLYLVLDQQEQLLTGELTPPAFSRNPLLSPDGLHFACILKRNNKVVVFRDGVESKTYDGIVFAGFSPDSRRFVYTAAVGPESFVVVDEVEGKRYHGVDLPQFSPDSKLVAYSAMADGGSVAIINEQESKVYPMLGSITISADSKRVAYLGTNAQKLTMAIVDGVEGKPYEGILFSVKFSHDSRHVAYVATHTGQTSFVVRDGVEQKEYPLIFDVVFSPTGERTAYVARKQVGDVVVLDDVEGAPIKLIDARSLAFSPDSQHVAYKVVSGNKELVGLDGVNGKKYQEVGYPAFSPESKHLAYLAREANAWRMVIGQAKSAAYESVLNRESVWFDDSGAVYFIAIRKGEAFRIKCSPKTS